MLARKTKQRVAASILLILLTFQDLAISSPAQEPKKCVSPVVTTDSKFKPGQVWHVRGRSWEPDAIATILRVETLGKIGTVIHIRLDHIAIHGCSKNLEVFEHSPISKDAFEHSVLSLAKTNVPIPDFKDGYDDWRANCGGVFTITIAEILSANEQAIRTNQGCA